MEPTRYIVRDEHVMEQLQAFLGAMNYGDNQPVEVTIKPYKRNRSLEANNLYWRWVEIIGNHLGYFKDETHEILKHRFLPHKDVEYGGESYRWWPSTSKLNTQEMSDYMTRVEAFAAEFGIALPHPEDR